MGGWIAIRLLGAKRRVFPGLRFEAARFVVSASGRRGSPVFYPDGVLQPCCGACLLCPLMFFGTRRGLAPRFRSATTGSPPRNFPKHRVRIQINDPYLEAASSMLSSICRVAGISTERRNIPPMKKPSNKTGRGTWYSKASTSAVAVVWSLTSLSSLSSAAITWQTSATYSRDPGEHR